ncbi:hypothetical protein [Nitrosomonas sp. H1_AOB3]|uniref:hypothetical protein n=1 Tax=Nitrosomonas sp. H1_AOB3 TaxID=2741553 RepID=UPI00338FCAC4
MYLTLLEHCAELIQQFPASESFHHSTQCYAGRRAGLYLGVLAAIQNVRVTRG